MIIYSNSCPKCNILKQVADEKGLQYEENSNLNAVREKGFRSLPVMEYKGEFYDFGKAFHMIKEGHIEG